MTLRHWPFLQALADCQDDHVPQWAACKAGLLVLGYFDHWMSEGPSPGVEERASLARVRQEIGAISDTGREVRALLLTALDVLGKLSPADVVTAVGPLLAYASYLEQHGQVILAQHVITLVTEVLDSPQGMGDVPSVADAYFHHGRMAQRLGDYEGAGVSYRRALALTELAGERPLMLHVRIAIGALSLVRGNLADAEASLDLVVAAAQEEGLQAVEARALRVRGGARQRRGRQENALLDFHRAYAITSSPLARELLAGDIASCTAGLGLLQEAKSIYRRLADAGRYALSRGIALVNLLEIAVEQGDSDGYRAVWDELRTHYLASLPVDFVVYAELNAARGVERFQTPRAAVAAYRKVVERASMIGVHHVEFLARDRLNALVSESV